MSSNIAVKVSGLNKCFHLYEKPFDRLMQMLFGRRKRFYKEFWALKDISFEIKRGETLGIVGRNGSGKSTLLQIICGTLNSTNGDINVHGRVAALLELGSGFNPEFTGKENVYLNSAVLGLSKQEIDNRYKDIVGFADIGEFIDQPVKTYSSGMYVRLAFAVIAHVDADILIVDEALAVGDALFTQKCMRFLRTFKEHGTLIFVSHDIGSVTGLCDKALWLNKGNKQDFGSAKEVSESYMASLYEDVSGRQNELKSEPVSVQRVARDIRLDVINHSNLRNEIRVFGFDEASNKSFGNGGATIMRIQLRAETGGDVSFIVGGELVRLVISIEANQDLVRPIVGFSIKDRLGQILFGDNTYITYRNEIIKISNGQQFRAEFLFQMPILPRGDYSLGAAVASGTQEDHVQHHWIHDAVFIKSISSSVSTGLVGVPMADIKIFM